MQRCLSLYNKILIKRREKQNKFFIILKVLNNMSAY